MATQARRQIIKLNQRDHEWSCHYCRCQLVPIGATGEPHYSYEILKCDYQNLTPEQREASEAGDLMRWFGRWSLNYEYQLPTRDHKVPRSKGGSDDLSNLVLCCPQCNAEKNSRYSYEEYKALWSVRLEGLK